MSIRALYQTTIRLFQLISVFLILIMGLGAVLYTILSAFGQVPWLTFTAHFGEWHIPEAGQATQIVLTILMVSMVFFLPSNSRIMSLENSHRNFHIKLEDVARAYHICHTADRAGVFSLSSEFDAVRERLAYLRDHPDLERLEPDVLEVAAQMSQQSRELADVYSNDKVTRARAFLQQRQEEAERQQQLIVEALHATTELRKWAQQVELEESVVASQLAQLEDVMDSTLPALGYSFGKDSANIVPIGQKPAAE
ncbi:DNA repair protein [Aestuariibius sp. HNIBRBA575]|uniref:DNA repair protein n=1 Tax=Aestuariibius sp. HNIBRBA575 TaxID=3233343 RepID=UPI0034A2F1EC